MENDVFSSASKKKEEIIWQIGQVISTAALEKSFSMWKKLLENWKPLIFLR